MSTEIKVVIADDHTVVRHGLRLFLDLEPDIRVVGEAQNGAEAQRVVRDTLPDVVVMDLAMPEVDGIAGTERIRAALDGPKVLILTSISDESRLMAALRAGASGYLLKDEEPAALAAAIRRVHAGEFVVERGSVMPETTGRSDNLTMLFSDVVGFADMTDRLGDEESLSRIRAFKRVVRGEAASNGGIEAELKGDGFLLAFEEATSAAACAVGIQRRLSKGFSCGYAISSHIGLHTGNVLQGDGGYFGKTIIVAARVASIASGGEVLVSEATMTATEADFEFIDRGLHALKGISEQQRLYAINWKAGA